MNKEQSTDHPKPKKQFRFEKRDGIFLIVGVLLAFTLRFLLVDNVVVHHHANFALYVNGVRDEFISPTFYEEIAACSESHSDPKTRVHMHNNEFDTVHVHTEGATWGHFFANLSYTLGDNVLVTDNGVFTDSADGKKLHFILNGQEVSTIANKLIGDEDKLLVNYGSEDKTGLLANYSTISDTAHEHNAKPDPASCSGGAQESIKDRFERTLGTLPKVEKH